MATRLEALRAASSLSDVALLLGVTPKGLAYTIRVQPEASRYTTFTIPKKSGGVRTINAPEPNLKLIQSRLAALLQDCLADINAERTVTEKISHGFRRGRSIVTNAQQHCNRRYVLNVDLKDFFPTINLGRVRGYFIKNKHFQLMEPAVNVLAQIACYNNELPQGAPTSPVISNLIAHILDIRLAGLAKSTRCHYTRYADDLTFSTNLRSFPPKMARLDEASGHWISGSRLKEEVKNAGFIINEAKTRIQFDQSRQDVTGIIVNKGVNVKAEYYKNARAKCNELFKTGKYFVTVQKTLDDGSVEFIKEDGRLVRLDGIMSFIDFVKYERRKKIPAHQKEVKDKKSRGFLLLYRKYLYYRRFFSESVPLILCEGKTDNTYIRLAAMSMYKKFPLFAEKSQKKIKLKVRLFNYSDTTLRLFGLSGGTGQFNKFMSYYSKNISGFSVLGKGQPVIVVIDNDSGSPSVFNVIGQIIKTKVNGDLPFYYIGANLYLVPTPKSQAGGETMIETFLPKKWLNYKLNGKSFNPDGETLDIAAEFGKFILSEHVIKKNHKDVDFKGFGPLLDNISSAIDDYYQRVAD